MFFYQLMILLSFIFVVLITAIMVMDSNTIQIVKTPKGPRIVFDKIRMRLISYSYFVGLVFLGIGLVLTPGFQEWMIVAYTLGVVFFVIGVYTAIRTIIGPFKI